MDKPNLTQTLYEAVTNKNPVIEFIFVETWWGTIIIIIKGVAQNFGQRSSVAEFTGGKLSVVSEQTKLYTLYL